MSIATSARFKKLNDSLREIDNEVVETQEHYVPSSPQQHLCSKSKRKTQWHQFRISQSEHVDLVLPPSPSRPASYSSPPTPTSSTTSLDCNPQIYHIPLESSKSKVDLFNIDFPLSLRGHLSASFYVEVISTLNHYKEGMNKSGLGAMWQKMKNVKVYGEVAKYIETVNNYSKHVKWCLQKIEGNDFSVTIEVYLNRIPINFSALQL